MCFFQCLKPTKNTLLRLSSFIPDRVKTKCVRAHEHTHTCECSQATKAITPPLAKPDWWVGDVDSSPCSSVSGDSLTFQPLAAQTANDVLPSLEKLRLARMIQVMSAVSSST